jgi:hypothetical protein
MPIDLSNPSGFSKTWDDIVTAFREVAIDQPMNGGNLTDGNGDPVLNDHITGPVDGQTLASQYAYPVVWSVPQTWNPDYRTTSADHGELQAQVVVFTQDQDQDYAFRKARELLARIVTNIEDDRELSAGTTDAAGKVGGTWMTNFQMDYVLASGGGQRAQINYGQALFQIDAKRLL